MLGQVPVRLRLQQLYVKVQHLTRERRKSNLDIQAASRCGGTGTNALFWEMAPCIITIKIQTAKLLFRLGIAVENELQKSAEINLKFQMS